MNVLTAALSGYIAASSALGALYLSRRGRVSKALWPQPWTHEGGLRWQEFSMAIRPDWYDVGFVRFAFVNVWRPSVWRRLNAAIKAAKNGC